MNEVAEDAERHQDEEEAQALFQEPFADAPCDWCKTRPWTHLVVKPWAQFFMCSRCHRHQERTERSQ